MYKTVYDDTFTGYHIEIKSGRDDVYYVYVNGLFYCSADNYNEAEDDVEAFIQEHGYKSLFEVI